MKRTEGDNGDRLTLEWKPCGRGGSATVTARLGGQPIAVETFDLTKGKAREKFVAAVSEGRPGIDRCKLEDELLKLAADGMTLAEIDASRIIRPERFITPEVSGLAVPTITTFGDKVVGRWQLYLRWADGKRERRALGPMLDLPGGGRLYVHPEPGEPSLTMKAGWSVEARQRWLDGEPAPNPAELFKRVAERVAYFLDLPPSQAPGVTAIAVCWVMLTYCYHAWPAVPYLHLGGPLGSGKSRFFEILARLVFRPLVSSNLTAPSLFRTQHSRGGVLLLDEAERLKRTQDPDVGEILAMLLAGYKAGGCALRLEPLGESGFKTVTFDVFGPKALACVAGLPPALASRTIPITMFRAAPGSPKPKRRIDADPSGWQRLRDDLHALALKNGPTWLSLADRTGVVPAGLSGRDYKLWQPLLSLASWIEVAGAGGLLKLMQEHALATVEAGRDDQTPDHDETLLKQLAAAVRLGERPTPGEPKRR